jgi:hypothetical protein
MAGRSKGGAGGGATWNVDRAGNHAQGERYRDLPFPIPYSLAPLFRYSYLNASAGAVRAARQAG